MYVPLRTNNPVGDAERWASREDERPLLGYCIYCNCEIRGSNDGWEADDAYEIDGDLICDICLLRWAEEFKIK